MREKEAREGKEGLKERERERESEGNMRNSNWPSKPEETPS
jgi:hypothetical protein